MDARRILGIIQDVNLWRGDVYRLATIIAEEQRETDARKAELLDAQAVADSIREAG